MAPKKGSKMPPRKGAAKKAARRALGNTNPADAAKNGWVVDKGDPGAWETVCKAHNDGIGLMKSTKRMRIPGSAAKESPGIGGGYLFCVTTEGPHGYAEALTFVPSDEYALPPEKPKAVEEPAPAPEPAPDPVPASAAPTPATVPAAGNGDVSTSI